MRKFISILAVCAMLVGMIPAAAFAADDASDSGRSSASSGGSSRQEIDAEGGSSGSGRAAGSGGSSASVRVPSVYVVIENTTYTEGEAGDGAWAEDAEPWTGTLYEGWVALDIEKKETAYDILKKVEDVDEVVTESQYGPFLYAINGLQAYTEGDWDEEDYKYYGWMVSLNDWFTATSIENYELEDLDELRFMYSIEGMGADLGGTFYNNDKTLKSLEIEGAEFKAVSRYYGFSLLNPLYGIGMDTDSIGNLYYAVLPDNETEGKVVVTPTASNKNFQVKVFTGELAEGEVASDEDEDESEDEETAAEEQNWVYTYYKRSEGIPVTAGDVIVVEVGDPEWPTMNYGAEEVEPGIYAIFIKSELKGTPTVSNQNEEHSAPQYGDTLVADISGIEGLLNDDATVMWVHQKYGAFSPENASIIWKYDEDEMNEARGTEYTIDNSELVGEKIFAVVFGLDSGYNYLVSAATPAVVKKDYDGEVVAPEVWNIGGTRIVFTDRAYISTVEGQEYEIVRKGAAEPTTYSYKTDEKYLEFTDLTPNTEYEIYTRVAETETTLASASAKTEIKTDPLEQEIVANDLKVQVGTSEKISPKSNAGSDVKFSFELVEIEHEEGDSYLTKEAREAAGIEFDDETGLVTVPDTFEIENEDDEPYFVVRITAEGVGMYAPVTAQDEILVRVYVSALPPQNDFSFPVARSEKTYGVDGSVSIAATGAADDAKIYYMIFNDYEDTYAEGESEENGDIPIASKNGVAEISDTTKPLVKITGAGDAMVGAWALSETHTWAEVFYVLHVERGMVEVTALDKRVYVNGEVPSLAKPAEGTDYEVKGLAEGDELVTDGLKMSYGYIDYNDEGYEVFTEAKVDTKEEGSYVIHIEGLAFSEGDENYYHFIDYTDGELSIKKKPSGTASGGSTTNTSVKFSDGSSLSGDNGASAGENESGNDAADEGEKVVLENGRVGEQVAGFEDVGEGNWFGSAVEYVVNAGLFKGVSDTEFNPQGDATREQVMTVLARFAGVEDATIADGLSWAVDNGISDGSNPKDSVTREQFVTMLYRLVQSQGGGFEGEWMFLLENSDAGEVSSWADEAMHWCVMNGVITGYEDGRLAPKDEITRAQMAVIMERVAKAAASETAAADETSEK